MENQITILIADRNPHVRDLLKREIEGDGYKVRLARDTKDLMKRIAEPDHINLLILDPDMPDAESLTPFPMLAERIPNLTTVIHTILSEAHPYKEWPGVVAVVEKAGNSIEILKKVISNIVSTNFSPQVTNLPHSKTITRT